MASPSLWRRAGELGKPAACPSRSPGAGAGLSADCRSSLRSAPRPADPGMSVRGPDPLCPRVCPRDRPSASQVTRVGSTGSLSADAPQLPTLPPSEVGAASRATLGGVELRCVPGQRLRRRARELPRLPTHVGSDCSWWLSRCGVLENPGSASVRGRAPFNEPWRLCAARYVRSEFAGGPEALSTQRMDS